MKTPRQLRFSSILLMCILPFIALAQEYVVRETASPCLNIRADHDTNSQKIGCLTPGTKVTVVNTIPFWREVKFGNNQQGWVAKKYLEPAISVSPLATNTSIPANAFLTLNFVDVGQGDAIWIQTHDDGIDGNGIFEGYSIIIDGGPYSGDDANPLLPYLENNGHHGANIEALMLTHPHTDHFKGAETISRHFSINHYYDPGYPSDLGSYTAFLKAMKGGSGSPARAKHVHIGKQNFGTLDWGKELKAEILYAWGDVQGSLGSGNTIVNNSSVVLRIEYGNHVFLFMGDAEGKKRSDTPATPNYIEQYLLQNAPAKLKATVLKIAHHGSETSSTEPFIQAVNPDIVIVQSGRKSFAGTFLPDASTLKRYCSHNPNVKIYRTDQGDEAAGLAENAAADNDHIVIRTNGSGQPEVKALSGGQPFAGNPCNH